MPYDGIYNLLLTTGSSSGNSPAVSNQSIITLVALDTRDDRQKWTIRPIAGAQPNAYTIQSSYTGAYVSSVGDSFLTFSLSPTGWFISDSSPLIQASNSDDARNWQPSDDGKTLVLGNHKSDAIWAIL